MAFKKRKAKAKSKPPVEPKLDPVGFDEMPEAKAVTPHYHTDDVDSKLMEPSPVPPRPHGAPPPEHCSHEFPGSEGKEFVYVIKPEHRDKYPSKKLVIPVD